MHGERLPRSVHLNENLRAVQRSPSRLQPQHTLAHESNECLSVTTVHSSSVNYRPHTKMISSRGILRFNQITEQTM